MNAKGNASEVGPLAPMVRVRLTSLNSRQAWFPQSSTGIRKSPVCSILSLPSTRRAPVDQPIDPPAISPNGLVVDDRAAFPGEGGETISHRLHLNRRVPNPIDEFTDHFHRFAGAVRVSRIAGELPVQRPRLRRPAFPSGRHGSLASRLRNSSRDQQLTGRPAPSLLLSHATEHGVRRHRMVWARRSSSPPQQLVADLNSNRRVHDPARIRRGSQRLLCPARIQPEQRAAEATDSSREHRTGARSPLLERSFRPCCPRRGARRSEWRDALPRAATSMICRRTVTAPAPVRIRRPDQHSRRSIGSRRRCSGYRRFGTEGHWRSWRRRHQSIRLRNRLQLDVPR